MKGPARADAALLHVRVQPRSSVTEVVGWQGSALRVRVTAAPVDEAANHAVLDLLARAFGVSRSTISLVRGAHSRDKLIRIAGLSRGLLESKLEARRTLE